MKKKHPLAVEYVCKKHCSFFKPGVKEDLACRGFDRIEKLLSLAPEISSHLFPVQDKPFENAYPHTLNRLLCQSCDFFIEGCDFTDPDYQEKAVPCGGYMVLDKLLQDLPSGDPLVLNALNSETFFVVVRPKCVLKKLEGPYLYDIRTDELYALDEGGFEFLNRCDGTRELTELCPDTAFLEYCLAEDLIALSPFPKPRSMETFQSPVPSLRYLELQITNRCNLNCRHCYLGKPTDRDMPHSQIASVVHMFEKMQGLRLLVSGGEPLLYGNLGALKHTLSRAGMRTVLLTNGLLVRENNHHQWDFFDEIQFSVDGLKQGHEALRGNGTFERVMKGIETAQKKGIDISIATMVHRRNLSELEDLAKWIGERKVFEWNLDVPCQSGRLSENTDFLVLPEEGAPFLKLAKGGSYHGSEEPFACGYHLCTVTPRGEVLKCGFFPDEKLGSVQEGLEVCWKRAHHIPLSQLDCSPCTNLDECKGGCRFRAPHRMGKDPVMCALYGHL